MTGKPRCADCGTIAVPRKGDVCGPCKEAITAGTDKLLKDLFGEEDST